MLATTSVEALVNARVETIRSPIEGVVASAPDVGRDWNATSPAPRLRIVDPLADHARLEDLRRQYQALESQSRLLARQSELASAALQTLERADRKISRRAPEAARRQDGGPDSRT